MGGISIHAFSDFLPPIELVALQDTNEKTEIHVVRRKAYLEEPSKYVASPPQQSILIEVTYSSIVRENQTLGVNAQISRSLRNPLGYGLTTWKMVEMTLDGAAFEIEPKTRRVNPNVDLPQVVKWTALPKRTGDHDLLLDCSKCSPPQIYTNRSGSALLDFSFSNYDIHVKLNQHPIAASELASVQLPVKVVTKWGVSQTIVDAISYVMAILGALIALPYFPKIIRLLHRLVSRRSTSKGSS